MKTIEISAPANPAALYLGALLSSTRRPGAIKSLPRVAWVRPQVILDAGEIARYAKVCGFSEVQGVPVTYPQMLTFPLLMAFFGSRACPWPAMGTVHLANRIEQHQPLNPGDTVRVEVSTGRLMAHDKGQVFTLEMKIQREGEIVWDATQTLLRTGVRNPAGSAFASTLIDDRPLSRQADFFAPADIGRRYGQVSGDLNPIHLSALSARLFGFRRAIAHGLWTQARALAALMPYEPVAQAQVAVEFKAPLFLPGLASLWTTRDTSGPYSQGALFEIRNDKGEKQHLRGRLSYQ
jgi:acyl dehydratase